MEKQDLKSEPFFRLLYKTPIIIPACDGLRTFASAKSVFRSHLNPDLQKSDFDKKSDATKELPVFMYKLKTFRNITDTFDQMSPRPYPLSLTQHQIIAFCEGNIDRIIKNNRDLKFLLRFDYDFYITNVSVRTDGLTLYSIRLKYKDDNHIPQWPTLLVVPKLIV